MRRRFQERKQAILQERDSTSVQKRGGSPHELTDERLRFVSSRGPDSKNVLFLISYPTLESQADGEGSSYRKNERWVEVSEHSEENEWFFEGYEDDAPAFYYSHQYLDKLVSPYLGEVAVKWYDSLRGTSDVAGDPQIFCSDAVALTVLRLRESPHYDVDLVTNAGLWSRSADGSWKLKSVLSRREILQRNALSGVAEGLIREYAEQAGDGRNEEDTTSDELLGTALALGAPLTIVPTFDALLFRSAANGTVGWESVQHLLAVHAEAGFLCNDDDLASELVVQHRSQSWFRSQGRWVQAHHPWPEGQTFIPFPLEMLPAAVAWWDGETKKPAAVPAPYSTPTSLSFVTDVDPLEARDFPLLGLVRGSIDDGTGWTRTPGFWEWEYVDVLDFENHMPSDEGDMRPWGGKYLYRVPAKLEVLALAFWDSQGDRYGSLFARVAWSDFVVWMTTEI